MSEEIIINLENLDSTISLKDEEYIHREKQEKLTKLIFETIEKNTKHVDREQNNDVEDCTDSWDDYLVPISQNPCFFIHGRRGSGKSIFLRGLRKKLVTDTNHHGMIKLLANVDPTIFAKGEIFFIYILSRITKLLSEYPRQSLSAKDNDVHNTKRAYQLLHNMSRGLQLLASSDSGLSRSSNADFFIEDSIRNSISSEMIKRNFHELVSIICKLKCTKALLITIDDVDMNFDKCSEILETTRKYMFSPHMIIVFAGDLSQYAHAIRGLHLNHFNIRNLEHDDSRKSHRDELLDQLENQYMTKLTPIEHRVEITGVDDELFYGEQKSITLKYKNEKHKLIEYLRYYLSFIYHKNAYYDVFNLLLDQPVRTLFQLVKHWIKFIPYVEDNGNIQSDKGHEAYEYLTEGLGRAFSQSLIMHHINFSDIHKNKSNELFKEILIHIGKLSFLPGSSQLIPTIGDTSDKEISLFLNAEAVRYISSYYHLFHYMLITYTMLQYMKSQPDFKYTAESERKFRNKTSTLYYTVIDLNNQFMCPWHTAFIIRSVEENNQNKFTHWPGIVRIMNHRNNFSMSKFLNFIESIKDVVATENNSLINQFVHALYNCICIITTQHGTHYYFSIYSLLDLMTSYLHMVHNYNSATDIKNYTKTLFQIRPFFTSLRMLDIIDNKHIELSYIRKKSISGYYAEISSNLMNHDDALYDEIIEWAKKYSTVNFHCCIASIDNAWNLFVSNCELTYANRIKNNKRIGIGSLFLAYVSEFTRALGEDIDSQEKINSKEFISSFPLWKVLLDVESSKSSTENESAEGTRTLVSLMDMLDKIPV